MTAHNRDSCLVSPPISARHHVCVIFIVAIACFVTGFPEIGADNDDEPAARCLAPEASLFAMRQCNRGAPKEKEPVAGDSVRRAPCGGGKLGELASVPKELSVFLICRLRMIHQNSYT